MNWLTVLVSLVVPVLAAIGPAPAAVAQDVRYTIAGDVAQPDSYNFPAGQPVYLLDLLQSSGSQFAEGSAVILRDSPPRAIGSEFVRPGQSDRGSMLAPGDIVILHRSTGNTDLGNAVLVTDDLPIVLQFVGTTSPVAALLESVQAFIPDDAQIPAVRTERGRAVQISITAAASLQHGDVLMLSSVVPVSGLRISETFNARPPTWQQGVGGSQPSFTSARNSKWGDATNQPEVAGAQALVAVPASSQTPPPVTNAALQTQSAVTSGSGSLLIPGLPGGNAAPAGASTLALPANAADGATLSSQNATTTSTQSTAGIQPAATEAAAIAEATNTMPGRSIGSNSSFWNMVFMAGLMISLGLVIAGWLKTRAEQDRMLQMDSALRRSVNSLQLKNVDNTRDDEAMQDSSLQRYMATAAEKTTSASEVSSEIKPAEIAEQPAPSLRQSEGKSRKSTSTDTPSRALVGSGEWLSGEWISGAESATAAQPAPAQPAAADATAAPKIESAPTMAEEIDQLEESDDTLEAMIQNRLPIRLQTADLPLKIAFFGRPAGPRRLRIDAAHDRIPAPHIGAGSRTGQRMTQPARASLSPAPPSAKQPVTEPEASTNTATPSASASHLDRALNSLQESSET